MPSIYQIGLPIPKDYSEFENMVKEFFVINMDVCFKSMDAQVRNNRELI